MRRKRRGLQTLALAACFVSLRGIADAAPIDIADTYVVFAGGTNPRQTFSDVRNMVISGRNVAPGGLLNGTWDGTSGIISSTAHQRFLLDGFESRQLGYALNSDLPWGTVTFFVGQSVTPNDTLVRYTKAGDADLDGKCGDSDVTLLGLFYDHGQTTGHTWTQGDFNYDGKVDDNDVTALGLVYSEKSTPLSPAVLTQAYGAEFAAAFEAGVAMQSSVPEPALAAGLLALVALGRGTKVGSRVEDRDRGVSPRVGTS